jgi:hypothetical protein
MPTAYYDSSLLTQRRQKQAIYSFKRDLNDAAITSNTPNLALRLTGGNNVDTSQELVVEYKEGACVCSSAANGYNSMGMTK